jgi:bifunctional non-homologous end joining protein LigD
MTKATTRKKTARKRTGRKTTAGKTPTKKRAARKTASVGSLERYNEKRDFTRTAEPKGRKAKARSKLRFVVQKHAASHLHFDFRLELDGVMKSWAVPKGPSYDPTVKRLAMEVEDHPIEYNKFEGTIPKGQYGGGTVMIWDRGTYEAESGGGEETLREGYRRGDLKIVMHGERMQGSWVLVRTRRADRGKNQWLLIKHRDEFATPGADIVAAVQTSVVTGRTMEEIAKGRRVWNSNR